jgi:Fe-S-cluster containining protein
VYALSIHVDYRCHQSGVCCTSDWDVPVELPLYHSLADALAHGRIRPASDPQPGDTVLLKGEDLPDDAGAMVARTVTGDCVFYHRGSGLCVVHRDAGELQLPATCRHFPRIAVRDWRGTFISLTHYCPTAADMLFRDDVPLEIVADPAGFPPSDYEGLRVDPEAWPPLLHPNMLMDLEAYSAWERHMIARCADGRLSPESVVATLERDARLLRTYRPGAGSLLDAIGGLPGEPIIAAPVSTLESSLLLHAQIMSAVPDDMRPEPDEDGLHEAFARGVAPEWGTWPAPLRRYLAAKAFANWTAYQGRGVLAIVRGLGAALALVRVEASRECRNAGRRMDAELLKQAFRAADFVLNHIAVGEDLAEAWSEEEAQIPNPKIQIPTQC